MITGPREEIIGENEFKLAGDEFLKSAIGKMDEKDKETLSLILKSPEFKKSCEEGTMKDENMKRIWKEYCDNK